MMEPVKTRRYVLGCQYQIPNGINSDNGFAKRKYPLMTENFRKKFCNMS